MHVILIIVILIVIFFAYLVFSRKMTIPFIYIFRQNRWKIGTLITDSPLHVKKHLDAIQPIPFETSNCKPICVTMADPFVVEAQEGDYYMFYEHAASTINNPGADIWVLHSTDLSDWKQLGPVLEEPFHLSFPNVFRIDDTWYMLPETGYSKQLRLYKATHFPLKWTLDSVLVDKIISADPIIFQHEGFHYMLFQNNEDFSLRLYLSKELNNGWREHPSSPIRKNKEFTRPGGKIGYIDNRLIYFIQDDSNGYGTGLNAFQIDCLNPTAFADHKLAESPVLFKFGNDWASKGMHHLSWIKLKNGQYFCAMDGAQKCEKEVGWMWSNLPKFR